MSKHLLCIILFTLQLTVNGSMEGVASARHPVVVGHDSVHQSSHRNHSMEEGIVLVSFAEDSHNCWSAPTSNLANLVYYS